jgi:hypothetical protein
MAVAKRTHQNVLSMSDEMRQNITGPAKSANDQSVKSMENTEVTGVSPSGSQVDAEQVVNSKPKN